MQEKSLFREDSSQNLVKVIKSENRMREIHLEYLEHFFAGKKKQKFSHISQILKNLSCLQAVSLKFQDCSRMTDTDLYHTSQGLQRISGLKTVVLHLFLYKKFTDNGIYRLGKSLRRLSSLKKLSVKLDFSPKMTAKSLELFGKSLKKLASLSTLTLNFDIGFLYQEEFTSIS